MKIRRPKDDNRYIWTAHSFAKMLQYRLSEQRIRRVIKSPKRVEEGIAKDTIAVMQPYGYSKKNPKEIWVMYCFQKSQKKFQAARQFQNKHNCDQKLKKIIIAAWIYPGISPVRKTPKIPEDILNYLQNYSNDYNTLITSKYSK